MRPPSLRGGKGVGSWVKAYTASGQAQVSPRACGSPLHSRADPGWRMRGVVIIALSILIAGPPAGAAERMAAIKARGFLTCGIVARVRGFTDVAADGRTT